MLKRLGRGKDSDVAKDLGVCVVECIALAGLIPEKF